MADINATVPDITAPFIMPNGNINPVWFHFFIQLFTRTESGNNPEIELIKVLLQALYGQTNSQVQTPFSVESIADQLAALQSAVPATPMEQNASLGDVPTHGLQTDEALHALVTTTLAGFMSAADKVKLNGIAGGAAVSSVSGTAPIVSSGGATPAISITAATTSAAGSMSAADKTKLDSVTSGAAVSTVTGTAPIVSSGGATPAISISAATTTTPGSMSAADKVKLNGIGTGAQVIAVTGTAPISATAGQNPVVSISPATGAAAGSMSAADKAKLDLLLYSTAIWTPTITFATPGNLAVTYAVQTGIITRVGRMLFAQFLVLTSSFTWTTSSGALQITGLPLPAGNINAPSLLDWQGITKAGYTQVNTVMANGSPTILFFASGSGLGRAQVTATDTPSGGQMFLSGTVIFSD